MPHEIGSHHHRDGNAFAIVRMRPEALTGQLVGLEVAVDCLTLEQAALVAVQVELRPARRLGEGFFAHPEAACVEMRGGVERQAAGRFAQRQPGISRPGMGGVEFDDA